MHRPPSRWAIAVAATALLSATAAAGAERMREIPVFVPGVAVPDVPFVEFAGRAATASGVAAACVTFTDVDARILDHIAFRIDFQDAERHVLATRTIDRHGTFSPNIPQLGYTGAGSNLRMLNGARQCAFLHGRAMTFPSAALDSVRVIPTVMHFSDGTEERL